MVSTARAARRSADNPPVKERAPLTKSFELALEELRAAAPEGVKFRPNRNTSIPDEWLGTYSMTGPKKGGIYREISCEHNDAARPPKISVTTFLNGKCVQQLPLNNPEASREFLDLFKDKVKAKDTIRSAKLTEIAADLPTTIDLIRTLERQGKPKTTSLGPIKETNQTYIGSLRDRKTTPIELNFQTYKYSNPDGSDRPIARILGKIGDIDIIATRHIKDGKNADALNITLGHANKLGRLMTKDASDKVATAVIETLLARALILEPAQPNL